MQPLLEMILLTLRKTEPRNLTRQELQLPTLPNRGSARWCKASFTKMLGFQANPLCDRVFWARALQPKGPFPKVLNLCSSSVAKHYGAELLCLRPGPRQGAVRREQEAENETPAVVN